MLIAGSSGGSGGLVGGHQPDEPMRDGGRWAGRRGRDCGADSLIHISSSHVLNGICTSLIFGSPPSTP